MANTVAYASTTKYRLDRPLKNCIRQVCITLVMDNVIYYVNRSTAGFDAAFLYSRTRDG